MKFEEALSAMRSGAKITHPNFLGSGVYFQACRVSMMSAGTPIELIPISIVKMKDGFQHPDMMGPRAPQLNLFLVMEDNWEIIE